MPPSHEQLFQHRLIPVVKLDQAAPLALDCVPACGGSWMVPTNAIAAGDFDHIASLTREAVNAVANA
jgi:2-keto-3-deoxy-6-phosphogluconate aldolase